MTDLLTHLVDAPLANIFILAGLIFLGIGILGKVSGQIEPSAAGRIMSAVLGAVLLGSGVYAHWRADNANQQNGQPKQETRTDRRLAQRPNPPEPQNVFSGEWINDNSATRGIRRLEVKQNGDLITVRAWGACLPNDCDWGETEGVVTGLSASVAWDQGFVLRKMTLALDNGRLKVVVDSVYRDNRPPLRITSVLLLT